MERPVGGHQPGYVTVVAGGPHRGKQRLQLAGQLLAPCPGPLRRVYLDQPARVDHILDLRGGHRSDEYPALGVQRDEALGLQAQQGFPDGGAGHPDGCGDLGLGQQCALGVDAFQDGALEVLVYAGGGGGSTRMHDVYKICHDAIRCRGRA